MDGQRFDQFARGLAAGRSRRSLLKVIGASLAGIALGTRARDAGAQDACDPNGTLCDSNEQCCSGACLFQFGETRCGDCTPQGGNCSGFAVCCDGLICEENFHICVPPPDCVGFGYSCGVFPCCDGYGCQDNSCCALPDTACSGVNDCCVLGDNPGSGLCIDGFCSGGSLVCVADGGACFFDEQCCDGGNCYLGACTHACKGAGFFCSDDEDCCDGYFCGQFDVCTPLVCIEEGEDCDVHADCCGGLFCLESECRGCGVAGASCENLIHCCNGFTCDEKLGECVAEDPGACAAEGDDCAGESGNGLDCCGDLFCKHAAGEAGVCVSICGGEGDPCEELLDCCAPDFVCNTGTNQCEAAAPAGCEDDGDCDGSDICCGAACVARECCGVSDQTHCGDGEVCTAAGSCEAAGPSCSVDADCVVGAGADGAAICCGGICRALECCPADADPNARCDDGEHCFKGICVFACKGDADCVSGTCCCADGSCYAECCADVGYTPPANSGGVSQLPNTGSGLAGSGDALTGALLAASAALAAGKLLRRAKPEPAATES